MLKNIATAHCEFTTQHESMVRYNIVYNVNNLIDFFDNDWKGIRKRTEKRNIYICDKHYTD